MPVYDYKCGSCDHNFECKQTFDSEPFAECTQCGAIAHRQLNCVPIIFKGSGFYITDSRKDSYEYNKPEKSKNKDTKEDKKEAKKEEVGTTKD
ncbi:FmdB family zinc ribbon protein [Chloroflexota bacterium]